MNKMYKPKVGDIFPVEHNGKIYYVKIMPRGWGKRKAEQLRAYRLKQKVKHDTMIAWRKDTTTKL